VHPAVLLAKRAIEAYVQSKTVIKPPDDLSPEMREKAGTFVSLKKGGQLRGCIGTFSPTTNSVAEEIIKNAISAAIQDPRFSPVSKDETDEITYSVDVLSEPESVGNLGELDPKKYGVIVMKGILKGLLLPDLEGVDTVEDQLRIAKMKAGIPPEDTSCEILRFSVQRYH
jgi:AmmeMemoRadiSam system protein A